MLLHVIIDATNVLTGAPADGVDAEQFVAAAGRWASSHARTPVVAVVFDGGYAGSGPGMTEHDERTVVVATDPGTTGKVILGEAEELREAGEPVLVVTSDEGLAARAAALGAKVVDGRAYLGAVLRSRR